MLIDKGVKIIKADGSDGRVDLKLLMDELYKLEIDSVLLEGGGTLKQLCHFRGNCGQSNVFLSLRR